MKKVWIILLLLAVSAVSAYGISNEKQDLLLTVSIDWQMSVQAGAEYTFNDILGVKAGLGISLMGMTTFDLFAVIDTLPPDNPWQLSLLVGIPNFTIAPTFNAAMLSFGGAIQVDRIISDSVRLGLRIGEGFPLFLEDGRDMIRDIDFPLNLWPELSLEVAFR